MDQISNLIKANLLEKQIYEEKIQLYRPRVDIQLKDFHTLLVREADLIMRKRFSLNCFEFDDKNLKTIKCLFNWVRGEESFTCYDNIRSNHLKGILLVGKVGTGKSLLLEAFLNTYGKITNKNIRFVTSADVSELFKGDINIYRRRPLAIDDIGREIKELNLFGTKYNPLQKLIEIRYSEGALTFGTSNFNFDTMRDFYGEHIISRMREMFNLILLPGEDRRK